MPITAHTSTTAPLMVDIPIPFFGKPKGNEKFIFNREGKLPFFIAIKKFFWQKEMCLAAKDRVIKLCENKKFSGIKKVQTLLSHINSPGNNEEVEVKESDVIDAFESVVHYLIPKRSEYFQEEIPEEFITKLKNNKKSILSEELIEEIKSNLNDRLDYISGQRGTEAFAALEKYLNKTGELKTAQAYSPLLEVLSAVIVTIGTPNTLDREIFLIKIELLHEEIQALYNSVVEDPRTNEI